MEYDNNIDYDNLDYKKLGFKCGLEIHQQLLTQKKLFCRCPAGKYSKKCDASILRHMRPTLSELGEYDGTALMEFKTQKEVLYLHDTDLVCTYEMDDTPPFEMNRKALDIALEIALLLKCSIVGELHTIRKQYLDGSIPAGFQRTAIVGIDGKIPYNNRNIGVIQLAIEEDACREVSDKGHRIIFRTDRLSIPLVEVVTKAEMRSPKEAVDVAQNIRKMLRVTGKVRRGIGAARQDVNVSINGGTRVEIKGVYKIPLIEKLTHNEAIRQHNLLKLRDKLRKKGFNQNNIETNRADVTDILSNIEYKNIKKAINKNNIVMALSLKGLKDYLKHPTQPLHTFVHELSERVKVIACLDDMPNIVDSDNKYNLIQENNWKKIFHRLDASENDVVCLVWGNKKDTKTALNEIYIRVNEATIGVPNETRQAFDNGFTGFERILPGPDRMYPDTDSPTIPISDRMIKKISDIVPETPFSKEKRYKKLNLPNDVTETLCISPQSKIFDTIISNLDVDPILTGVTIVRILKRLKRDGIKVDNITDDNLYELFKLYSEKKLYKEIFNDVLKNVSSNRNKKISETLEENHFTTISKEELLTEIRHIIEQHRDKVKNKEAEFKFLMGKLMERIKGRYKGEEAANTLKSML